MRDRPSYERERRFLVTDTGLIEKHKGNLIVQAFLFSVDGYVVRVRRTHFPNEDGSYHDGPAMVTLKGPRVGSSREEYEMEVPKMFAAELIRRSVYKISKTRYQLIDSGQVWDLDVFHGDNEGLMIAECETEDVESVRRPTWCDTEVTNDRRYDNERLAIHPICTWDDN
jgi:adenylate cyclase